jgi:hypothetical protein
MENLNMAYVPHVTFFFATVSMNSTFFLSFCSSWCLYKSVKCGKSWKTQSSYIFYSNQQGYCGFGKYSVYSEVRSQIINFPPHTNAGHPWKVLLEINGKKNLLHDTKKNAKSRQSPDVFFYNFPFQIIA